MSLSMIASRAVLNRQTNVLRSAQSIQAALTTAPPEASIPRRLRRWCHVSEQFIEGFRVVTLTPRAGASGVEIVYLHGGAYVNPVVAAHWSIVAELISSTGATVTVPMYGLAPHHTVADAVPLLDAVAGAVAARAQGRQCYFAGDSAGGGLGVALALHLRDSKRMTPAGLFLFSPWLDPSMSNSAAKALVPHDVMLDIDGLAWCGQQWAGDTDVRDPLVSPMYARLEGLPPTYIYQGGHDIFLADAMKFTERAVDAGVELELRLYPDGFHVFVGATFTPEARAVFRHVKDVVTTRR